MKTNEELKETTIFKRGDMVEITIVGEATPSFSYASIEVDEISSDELSWYFNSYYKTMHLPHLSVGSLSVTHDENAYSSVIVVRIHQEVLTQIRKSF